MSKKYLMVIANYPDERQAFFEKYMSPRNKEYSRMHNFEYLEYKEDLKLFRDNPTWWKFTVVRDLINSGVLKSGSPAARTITSLPSSFIALALILIPTVIDGLIRFILSAIKFILDYKMFNN